MSILDNLENSWELEVPEPPQFESSPMQVTDNMGREIFWDDLDRTEEPNLAVKLFSETCCTNCSCK